ncbi:MAG: hypothetical protein HQK59_10550, partial [Deltaproteobacteria bacterium]|nr:hypothetical protein [Deltaproteobacteria bacterium]
KVTKEDISRVLFRSKVTKEDISRVAQKYFGHHLIVETVPQADRKPNQVE